MIGNGSGFGKGYASGHGDDFGNGSGEGYGNGNSIDFGDDDGTGYGANEGYLIIEN